MSPRKNGGVPESAVPFLLPTKTDQPIYGRTNGIWWRASGTGDPVVLVQGLGYPAAMFHRLVPLLEPHCRVIVFDHRGIGNSARANGLDSLSIGRMAGDVADVIDEVAGGAADVVGVSLGGIVAQELALAYPRHLRRLVLAGTHTADDHVVYAAPDVLEMMKRRSELADEEALRSSLPYVYAPNTPKRLIDEDVAIRRAMQVGWDGYNAQLRATFQFGGTSARLPRINAETLVIHGELDQLVPVGNATVIAERIPGAQLRILDGLSHNFYSEAAKRTAAELVPFLTAPRPEPELAGAGTGAIPVA